MTHKGRNYQRTAVLFFAGVIILAVMAGTAGAKIEPSKVICRVETDRAVLPAGESQNVVLKITLDAPPSPPYAKRPAVNIGLVLDYNEDLMTQLAQKSDGNTYFVESGYDLPGIFATELGDVLNVVAKKVKVTITLPDNIKAVDIIGRDGRIQGNKIELFMNQLYGDQEKYALVEVKIPQSISGSRIKIARADVTYENPFSQKLEKSSGISYVAFSSDSKKVAGSTNIDVVREYQLNLNALAQEKAIELSDKGRKQEAVKELKQSVVRLKQLGARYNDPKLLKEADDLEIQADMIEDRGMSKKSRKMLRTKSYQMKNQQLSQ